MKKNKQNKQYDCLMLEAGFAGTALKGLQHFSRASYGQAALRGAGIGASVGGVGNVVNNVMKRDDDPTKVGMGKAFIKGAAAGAGTGATMGAGARFITNRTFAQNAMQNLAQRVHGQEVGGAVAAHAARIKAANPNLTAAELQAKLNYELPQVQNLANQNFAREYGYKFIQGRTPGDAGQMKIMTGVKNWNGWDPARRKYYDLQNIAPEYVSGEQRNIPEILTQAADRRS